MFSVTAPLIGFVFSRLRSSNTCALSCTSDESIWEPEHAVNVGSTHVTAGTNDRCRCLCFATRHYNATSPQSNLGCQHVSVSRIRDCLTVSRLCPLRLPSKTGNGLPRYPVSKSEKRHSIAFYQVLEQNSKTARDFHYRPVTGWQEFQ